MDIDEIFNSTGNNSFIRNRVRRSYEELLLYYYKKGLGNISEVAGAVITESLISTIENRYKQLGGNPSYLRLKDHMPSKNGTLNNES